MRRVKIGVRRNQRKGPVPHLTRVNPAVSRKTKYQRKKARKVIVKKMRKGLIVVQVSSYFMVVISLETFAYAYFKSYSFLQICEFLLT